MYNAQQGSDASAHTTSAMPSRLYMPFGEAGIHAKFVGLGMISDCLPSAVLKPIADCVLLSDILSSKICLSVFVKEHGL